MAAMTDDIDSLVTRAAARCCAPSLSFVPPPPSSRRRRLWELDGHTHCPVIGICLPIEALRRLVDKARGEPATAEDYELHCSAMNECKRRSPIAEAMQKELDRRYALALQQSGAAKTAEALEQWWRQARDGIDIPGAVWAVLTHPRCAPALEHQVLGEVHMLQHQIGAAQRVDRSRFDAAMRDNASLQAALAALRERQQQQTAEHARQGELLQSNLVQARAELIGRETTIAALRDELARLEAAMPDLKTRIELVRNAELQSERIVDLTRALTRAQQDAERQRRRADEAAEALAGARLDVPMAGPDGSPGTDDPAPSALGDRAVLCVGGRPASVPLYRHIVEKTGGRFLHHDGGDEQSVVRLDANLASADLVICQTGCISHGAYWRVKEHCKRTGTPCVFVENPGTASLKRALAELKPVAFT
jgi:hypothetical protein